MIESDSLMSRAIEHARRLGSKPPAGYRRLKGYARQALAERMQALDAAHLGDLVEQWFSEDTQRLVVAAVERMTKSGPAATRA